MYYDRNNRDDINIKEQRDTVDFDFQHQVALGRRHDFIWGGGYRPTSLEAIGHQGGISTAEEVLPLLDCQIEELTRAMQESLAINR